MVYLIDLTGKIVHTWKMPHPPGLYGYLTDKGTLFYNGKIPNDTFLGKAPFKGGAALEADWNGKVMANNGHGPTNAFARPVARKKLAGG